MIAAIQDLLPDNLCFGCGPHNEKGFRIKSYWRGGEAVCEYRPEPHQTAGPEHILNGGVIATLIDCHSICTALAHTYTAEGRAIGSEPTLWFATGRLDVRYLKPTPIDAPVELRARVTAATDRKISLSCTLASGGVITAEADVTAVRVPDEWRGK
jgi:acyl-coenzyme A thioesterase PaaI-like protein